MASGYSGNVSIAGNSNMLYRAYVNAWVSSQTDTTATVSYSFSVEMYWAYQYGVKANIYVNGSWQKEISGYLSSNPGANWRTVCSGSDSVTISKGSSAKSIPVKVNAWGETVSGYGSAGGSISVTVYVPISAITYYAPNAPSGLASVRESDSKNVLSWTGPSTSTTKPVSAILVERQVDGGSWSQVASLAASSTGYNDTSTSADHSYAYRVRAQNVAGYSGYATSGTTYNTPAAPTKVEASRLAETTVALAIANPANTATALELQRSTDAASWADVATIDGTVTEATDEPGGGTFYYRARNTRGELASDWSPASNAVVTITPPNAPTLKAPPSGAVVRKAQSSIEFQWAHNPIDGSAQTAAELRLSTDGGATWETVAVEGDGASYAVSNAFAVNSTVTWGARTKGAHEDFGPWSGNRVFYVRQEPSVAFSEPADGFIVENTPIEVSLQYDDPSGELAGAVLTVTDGAKAVYTRNMGTSTEAVILASEWLPENGMMYTLEVSMRSTSTLSASAVRAVSVDFVLPKPADVSVENDVETGYANLVVYVGEGEGLEEPASVAVWREHGGKRVLLADGLQAGSAVVDRYAPINSDYRYIVTSFADSGAANSTAVPARIDSQWFYFLFGGEVAKGRINPSGSRKVTRPNRRQVHFAGRALPVSFDDGSVSEERSVSMLLRSKAEADAFERMVWEHGRCVYKSGDGDVMHADVDVSDKQEWMQPTYYGSVSVSLTRIDGRDL